MNRQFTPQRNYTPYVWILSAIAVLTILATNYIPRSTTDTLFGIELTILPLINAILNGITVILLILALRAIKNGNIKKHRNLIFSAFSVTFVFLITYLTYHALAGSTSFGGVGLMKLIYYLILVSHITLSIVLLPLVFFTLAKGLNRKDKAHRKLARWAMPIWLYVSFTGVLVYLLIFPYY